MYPRVFFSVRIRTAVRIKTTAAVTGTWHNSDGGRFLPGMEHYYPPQAIFRFPGIFFSAYVQQYVCFSTVSKEYLVRSRDLVQHVTVGTCVQQCYYCSRAAGSKCSRRRRRSSRYSSRFSRYSSSYCLISILHFPPYFMPLILS